MTPVQDAHLFFVAVIRSLKPMALAFYLLFPLASWSDSERKNSLNFEDAMVESVNKKPLDSLNQINEKDGKKKRSHLYSKKTSLEAEAQSLLNEMGYKP
jgi:hypothetical protein